MNNKMLHIMISWKTLYYMNIILSYIHTVGNLPVPMGNIDTVRIRSSEVLSSNQVMKSPDPAYQDLSSFPERATVI